MAVKAERALVSDFTVYDDQLFLALMQHNAEGKKGMPRFGYAGLVWTGDKKDAIADAVSSSVLEHLMAGFRSGQLKLPGDIQRMVGSSGASPDANKPQYQSDAFKVSCPRGNLELAIRQDYYDVWGRIGTAQFHAWNELVKKHDAEFNTSGVPWKNKREPEMGLPALADATKAAEGVAPPTAAAGDPKTTADLEAGSFAEMGGPGGQGTSKLIVVKNGTAFLMPLGDAVIQAQECLFQLRGKFKTKAQCAKIMSQPGAWIPYELKPDTFVKVDFKGPLPNAGPYPMEPKPLRDLLDFLHAAGCVKPTIHLHKAVKTENDWVITADEPCCLEVSVEDKTWDATQVTKAKVSLYADLQKLRASQVVHVVHHLTFDPNLNKLNGGLPGVHLVRNMSLSKGGALIKLY